MLPRRADLCLLLLLSSSLLRLPPLPAAPPDPFADAFVNFETAPVHPLDLHAETGLLVLCNLPDARLELFDIRTGRPMAIGQVPVGLDPVTVRFRTGREAWVVNHISDSISIVDVIDQRVVHTLQTLDTPTDVVFAGNPPRAFVACSRPNTLQVFDPVTRQWLTNIVVDAERPRALAVSPDGMTVYAAIFESGNGTTLVGPSFDTLAFISNAVSRADGPYAGQNPPPNEGAAFQPPLHASLTQLAPPPTGLIVRKSEDGRWLDDNGGDWTEFVSGSKAAATERIPGWDLPDRDLAILDTTDLSLTYASRLMNLCMAVSVNPVSGQIAVVGTDARNEVRFEPNLRGVFVQVKLALIPATDGNPTVLDLNPHLDYSTASISPEQRRLSIGDPRAMVWSSDGARAFVAGMGSRNLVVVDAQGTRLRSLPIEVGEGPAGLALDEERGRLYVYDRFSSSLTTVDTATYAVLESWSLFDPTPLDVAAGRPHLYDTRRTSGLGQAACASCHVDARMDRLAWDLGNPAAEAVDRVINQLGQLITNRFHPMKGVMLTQTLQDIIGHEPFHWRGDRPDIESFNATFTDLQAAEEPLTPARLQELRDFLASIRFPPNPFRSLDNSLPTALPLPGQRALGEGDLPAGSPLPPGNAVNGLALFNTSETFCVTCHTLPTGLGKDRALINNVLQPVPLGPNDAHSFPLAPRLEGQFPSKISQFRNMADRLGMDKQALRSPAGFGFGHDGSIDTLVRFMNGARVRRDQDVADLIALMLAAAGSDTRLGDLPADTTPAAAVGRQWTLSSPSAPAQWQTMIDLAASPTGRVDLIARGVQEGLNRGWWFDRRTFFFQSDRALEDLHPDTLLSLAGEGRELTLMLVPEGTGRRLALDRDLDGVLDRDELDAGSNPADRQLQPRILDPPPAVPAGSDLALVSRVPPLPGPGTLSWWKDGQPIAEASASSLTFSNVTFEDAGEYRLRVETSFQNYTSAPVQVVVAPLLVDIHPASLSVGQGSNALLTAVATGTPPFEYQWQHENQPLPGATNETLLLTNVQTDAEGRYTVTAANVFGAAASLAARLAVLVPPTPLIPPVNLEVVQQSPATFSFLIAGNPPPFQYLLRKSSVILTNYLSESRAGFLTIPRVRAEDVGTYLIIVSNAASVVALPPVELTLLADTDRDRMPDTWELLHQLDPDDPEDAVLDADGDGQLNREEQVAGTDPNDPASFLHLDTIRLEARQPAVTIEFRAAPRVTYTLEASDRIPDGAWHRVADVVATPEGRLISLTNQVERGGGRYFRLVAPRRP